MWKAAALPAALPSFWQVRRPRHPAFGHLLETSEPRPSVPSGLYAVIECIDRCGEMATFVRLLEHVDQSSDNLRVSLHISGSLAIPAWYQGGDRAVGRRCS